MLPRKTTQIVQSNRLIEAQYRLNLQEKRLVLWLISQIHKDDLDFKKYEISVVEFAKMMEMCPDTQRKELKKITASLVTRLIQIECDDETKQLAWLSFAKWSGGKCFVEFHPELKPYLLQLKEQFTQISFADLMGFKGAYTARILEITAQYAAIGTRLTTINELKGWCGIGDEEYQQYKHFKSRIINPAKKEINEKTSYTIDYKEIKYSRKVEKINWIISKKNTHKEVVTKSQPIKNLVEISHKIKEVADFVKVYENEVSGIHYLLNAIDLKTEKNTLIIIFDDKFFKSQCEQNIVLQHRLKLFFKTQHVEIL